MPLKEGGGRNPLRLSGPHGTAKSELPNRVAAALEQACAGLPVPPVRLDGAGSFTCAGPMGGNGLSGRKLVADAYGPTVPVGGGAWSGKDLRKVDRPGGLLALARRGQKVAGMPWEGRPRMADTAGDAIDATRASPHSAGRHHAG